MALGGNKGQKMKKSRKTPVGGAVRRAAGLVGVGAKKPAKKRRHNVSESVKENRAKAAEMRKKAYAEGYRQTAEGRWTKPKNVKAYDNAKASQKRRAGAGPNVGQGAGSSTRASKVKAAKKRIATSKRKPSAPIGRARPARPAAKPKKPARTAQARAGAKIRARNPGLSTKEVRSRARQMVASRKRLGDY